MYIKGDIVHAEEQCFNTESGRLGFVRREKTENMVVNLYLFFIVTILLFGYVVWVSFQSETVKISVHKALTLSKPRK